MIIIASHRTGIPAFHSEWMLYRLRAGCAPVRSPVSGTAISRIGLSGDSVDCIAFITRARAPWRSA